MGTPSTSSAPAASPGPGPGARLRGGALAFCVCLYLAWISAAHIPLEAAVSGALSPTDLARDFVAAEWVLRGEPLTLLDGARGNAEAVRLGAEPVIILGQGPFHLHPPPAALPILPLVPLGFHAASVFWLALSICLLGVLARLLAAASAPARDRPRLPPTALFALLVLWPPVLTNMQLGQWSIVLATVIAIGHRLWEDGRPARGAAWMGAAAALKLTPLLLLPFVALRDRRAAAVFVGVMLGAGLLALPFGGLDGWVAFQRDAAVNVVNWQTWWHNTLSLNGLCARLLAGGRFARPLVQAPLVGRGLLVGAAVTLSLTALAVTRGGAGARRGSAEEGCAFALWNILVVLLNPLAWHHYAILLLLPAALVLRAADHPGPALDPGTRRRLRAGVATALVILTVPKETLYLLVRPLPTSPATSLLLSWHAYGALLLFATAAAAARSQAAPPRQGG